MSEATTTALAGWRTGPCYYVSVVNTYSNAGHFSRYGLLAGPFREHTEAEGWVEKARAEAIGIDPYAWFHGFGTCKAPDGKRIGRLNERLGIIIE